MIDSQFPATPVPVLNAPGFADPEVSLSVHPTFLKDLNKNEGVVDWEGVFFGSIATMVTTELKHIRIIRSSPVENRTCYIQTRMYNTLKGLSQRLNVLKDIVISRLTQAYGGSSLMSYMAFLRFDALSSAVMKMGSSRSFKFRPNYHYSSDKHGFSTFFCSEFEQFASRISHERAVHWRGNVLWLRQSSSLDMTELLFFEGTYGHSFTRSPSKN